jgi:hypothetical protein
MKFLSGLNLDWYHPAHMNGNLLSYASRRAQIGDFAEERRLSDSLELGVGGGTAFQRGISWKDAFTRESLKSVAVSMNLDVEVQVSGSAQVDIFEVGGSTTASFHMDERTAQTNIARTSVEKERAFTVNIPAFSAPLGYQITPLMYRTSGGVLKTSHVVDLLNNRSLWESYYSGAPDPALNLPRLWRYVEGSDWTWAAEDPLHPDARKIRGIFFRNSRGADLGKSIPLGETVTMALRVHNFSLVPSPEVEVLFEAVSYDGSRTITLGTARTPRIDQWGSENPNWKWVTLAWNTAGMIEGNYKIRVTVNPEGAVAELPLRALGEAYDNNQGWYDVFVGRPRSAFAEQLTADGLLLEDANTNLMALTLELENTPADGRVFALGETVLLRGTVRNEGELPVGNISLFFYDGNPDRGGEPFANRIISGILPGGEYSLLLSYSFETPGSRSVFMRVVPKVGDPPEDNTVSVAVPVEGGHTGRGGCTAANAGGWSGLMLLGLVPLALRRRKR